MKFMTLNNEPTKHLCKLKNSSTKPKYPSLIPLILP